MPLLHVVCDTYVDCIYLLCQFETVLQHLINAPYVAALYEKALCSSFPRFLLSTAFWVRSLFTMSLLLRRDSLRDLLLSVPKVRNTRGNALRPAGPIGERPWGVTRIWG